MLPGDAAAVCGEALLVATAASTTVAALALSRWAGPWC